MENIIIEDRGYYKLMYNPKELYIYIEIEYNTDTSAQLHRNMDEDIVRHSSEEETGEAEDKEPQI